MFLTGILHGFVSSQSLLTLLPNDGQRTVSKPCRQPGVESCTQALPIWSLKNLKIVIKALVNMTLLKTSNTILIPVGANEDILLQLSSRSENSAVFKVGELFLYIYVVIRLKF